MNILGIIASSTLVAAGDFESIATVSVGGGGAANVEFTSIPATYTHLQIRGIGRVSESANQTYLEVVINSDTGSNYAYHLLQGDGSGVAAGVLTSQTLTYVRTVAGSTAGSNIFGAILLDILDYTNTNKYKTLRNLGGSDNNGNGNINLTSSLWRNTAAITSIKFTPLSSATFNQYSQFALYGIRSA